MSGTAIFRGYDRAGLDREYDNQTKVPGFDFSGFLRHCDDESVRARQELKCILDVPFGPHPEERLDIFPAALPNAPVHVFFHGGYWRMLDKKNFSYVAHGIVPNGVTLVVVNYALIPTVRMAELVAQCRRALHWVTDYIAEYGGDASYLSVSGHSAGGHLAAMMLAGDWEVETGRPAPVLRHVCSQSGIFELEPIRLGFLNDVLQLSADEVTRFSPRYLQRRVWSPLSLLVGEQEGVENLRQSSDLAAAWSGSADQPRVLALPGIHHFSMRAALGDPQSEIVALTLRQA